MMEKLILLKPQEREDEEKWLDEELSSIAEEIQALRKRGADPKPLLFHLGNLIMWMGNPKCNVEQYIRRKLP